MSTRPHGGEPPQDLRIDGLIDDPRTRILVCCGAGGVGKTTTAAAVALRAARAGRTVVVLTIDPARRLAQSLGLAELDNTPRPVEGAVPESGTGSLDAMMLDMKRTFDEVVLSNSTPEAAQAIFDNPFYQAVSSSFAGTQEYMAMERLGQLHAEGTWDLIVVDTPPSRSALDFLDAPDRLGSFLDSTLLRLLTAPARVGGRASLKVLSAGVGLASTVLGRVLGGSFLRDVQTFIAAMDTTFGGFRRRAEATYALLQDARTSFLVVATPDRDALREASYFLDRLAQDSMPLGGLLINRVAEVSASLSPHRARAAAEALESAESPAGDGSETSEASTQVAALLREHVALAEVAERHRSLVADVRAGRPDVPAVTVPRLARDVTSLDDLDRIGALMAGEPGAD